MSYAQRRREIKSQKKIEENQRSKQLASQQLKSIAITRFKTTFIGALSLIEKELGDELWDESNQIEEEDMDEDQLFWYNKFLEVRKKLLDLGNSEMKSFVKELSNFDISFKPTVIINKEKDV